MLVGGTDPSGSDFLLRSMPAESDIFSPCHVSGTRSTLCAGFMLVLVGGTDPSGSDFLLRSMPAASGILHANMPSSAESLGASMHWLQGRYTAWSRSSCHLPPTAPSLRH